MTDQELIDQVNLNAAKINSNITRLNTLLSVDESTGIVAELNSSLVQSVSDINEWVNSLEALLNSKHDDQEDSIDTISIRAVSNTFRIDQLRTEEGLGIIKDIYDDLTATNNLILDALDTYNITYDTALADMALNITANQNGLTVQAGNIVTLTNTVTSNQTTLNLRADAIELSVSSAVETLNGNISTQAARIDVHDDSINTVVGRVDTILSSDGSTGLIKDVQSSITQTADQIAAEVIAREALTNGAVATNATNITQTASAISAVATAASSLSGRVDTAEAWMTAKEIVLSILSQATDGNSYSIQSLLSLTSNAFSVAIEEALNGDSYVAGLELILYPLWFAGTEYVIDDYITYTDDNVYYCIQDHTASSANAPDAGGNSLWNLTTKERSEFIIAADKFKIIDPTEAGATATSIFEVDTSGVVSIKDSILAIGNADRVQAALDAGADIKDVEVDGVTFIDSSGNVITDFLKADEIVAAATKTGTLEIDEKLYNGKTAYNSSTEGFFIGKESSYPCINIGDSSKYLKFHPLVGLVVGGDIIASGNIQASAVVNSKLGTDAVSTTKVEDNAITALASGEEEGTIVSAASTLKTLVTCTMPYVTSGETIYINFSSVLRAGVGTNPGYEFSVHFNNSSTAAKTFPSTSYLQMFDTAIAAPYTDSSLDIQIKVKSESTSSAFPDLAQFSDRNILALVTRR